MRKKILGVVVLTAYLAAVGCSSTHSEESTGQFVDSSAVTMKVKSKLVADKSINALAITVKTYKNSVMLSGFVDTVAQKHHAVEVARHVKGVASVTDALVVKSA
jgi:hyperosmotically inducible protein